MTARRGRVDDSVESRWMACGFRWTALRALAPLGICCPLWIASAFALEASRQDTGSSPSRPSKHASPSVLDEARRLCRAERYDEALALLEAEGRATPGDREAIGLRASVLLELHRPAEAEALFAALLASTPTDVAAHVGLAAALERQGDLERAAEALARALDLDPGRREALFAAGQLAWRRRENKRARDLLEKGLTLEPWGPFAPAAHYTLAQIAIADGRREDAARERRAYETVFHWAERRAALERRLASNPNDGAARRALAACLREAGDGKGALELLLPMGAVHPGDVKLKLEIAESHALAGDRRRAQLEIEAARRAEPSNPAPLRLRAALELRAGDLDTAWKSLTEALDLDPTGANDPGIRTLAAALEATAAASNREALVKAIRARRRLLGD